MLLCPPRLEAAQGGQGPGVIRVAQFGAPVANDVFSHPFPLLLPPVFPSPGHTLGRAMSAPGGPPGAAPVTSGVLLRRLEHSPS